MEQESQRQSFIVRIWLEETVSEAGVLAWRGKIIHVSDGAQRYINDLCEIPVFISPYLEEMGVSVGHAGAQKNAQDTIDVPVSRGESWRSQ